MAAICLALAVAGCGGGHHAAKPKQQRVRGASFQFSAPAGWPVTRKARTVSAAPPGPIVVVSVSVFPLERPYRPELWPRVVKELDRVAAQLATRQGGLLTGRSTRVIAGRRSRVYEIGLGGAGERVAFVLRGRQEYQLFCRFYRVGHHSGEPPCRLLFSSFTLA